MIGRVTARGLLLLALGLALAGAAAAEEAQPFRRWGLGWGDWIGSDYYDAARGLSLRYRLPSGWSLTLGGSFATSSTIGQDWDEDYYGYDYTGQSDYEPVARSVALECARSYALNNRLSLAPVLRVAHNYGRRVEEYVELAVANDENDWVHAQSRRHYRSETLRFSVGLRPQITLHPRVTVESGVFLDYWRSNSRRTSWYREEWNSGSVEEDTNTSTAEGTGWSWSVPSPSVTMGLILFFYF